jgi:hypothetical protein
MAVVAFALAVATVWFGAVAREHEFALVTALGAVGLAYIASQGKPGVIGGVLGTLAMLVGVAYVVLVAWIAFGQ